MSIKFLVLGGGGNFGFGGGGSADFIFMGAGIFLNSGHVSLEKKGTNAILSSVVATWQKEG